MFDKEQNIKKIMSKLDKDIQLYDSLKEQLYNECEEICESLKEISYRTNIYNYEYIDKKNDIYIEIEGDNVWIGVDPKRDCIKRLWDLSIKEQKKFIDISPKVLKIAEERLKKEIKKVDLF